MMIHSAMKFHPPTREECEGFQMLAFGVCCATCEWSDQECPFGRRDSTYSDSAYSIAESARSSRAVLPLAA
jgi:hypothetical protein